MLFRSAGGQLLDKALQRAHGTPILAEGVFGEQIALAGGRVWMSNPLDAFSHRDQRLYLDWLAGKPAGDAALRHAPRVVLVSPGGSAQERLKDSRVFRPAARDSNAILYLRRP